MADQFLILLLLISSSLPPAFLVLDGGEELVEVDSAQEREFFVLISTHSSRLSPRGHERQIRVELALFGLVPLSQLLSLHFEGVLAESWL